MVSNQILPHLFVLAKFSSKHYGSILSGFLRLITFSSAAVRLELGLSKVSLPSLVDRSQLILCLDSLGLVTTVVTTWMIPQFILAWAAIRCQADTHAIVMPDSSSLAILGIAALSFSSIILEGYILRHSVHTQQSIEKAEIRLTEWIASGRNQEWTKHVTGLGEWSGLTPSNNGMKKL